MKEDAYEHITEKRRRYHTGFGRFQTAVKFDKVMEEAAASGRSIVSKILEYIPGESGSDCPLHFIHH